MNNNAYISSTATVTTDAILKIFEKFYNAPFCSLSASL